MNVYSSEISNDVDSIEWITFLKHISGAHFRQFPAWAKAKVSSGYDARLLLVRCGDELMGGAMVLIKRFTYGCRIGIVSQGPCLKDDSPQLIEFFIAILQRFCRQSNFLYLLFELPYSKPQWLNSFVMRGFMDKPSQLPGGFFYKSTWMIDLTRDEQQIFSEFSAARRRYVRKSASVPVTFREGNIDDIEVCYKLFLHTANNRNGFLAEPHKSFYRELLSVPSQSRQVLLLIGEVEEQVVSASFCLLSAEVFMHYIWGWSGDYADQHYSDAVYWYMIRLAKNRGFHYFDFVQVDDRVASAIVAGIPVDDAMRSRSFFGPTFYKMSFGGEVVQSPGILCYYPSALHRWFFNKLVVRLLENRLLNRLLNRLK